METAGSSGWLGEEWGEKAVTPKDRLDPESALDPGVLKDILWARNLSDEMYFKGITHGVQKKRESPA